MKHSKGPWKRGSPYGLLKTEVLDADGRAIATVWTKKFKAGVAKSGETEPWLEGENNLNLILSAPELLEACKMSFAYVDSWVEFQESMGRTVAEDTLELHAGLEKIIQEINNHD